MKAKHIFSVLIRGSTISAKCSCGKRMEFARGCNESGLAYSLYYARNRFLAHCNELRAIPFVDNADIFERMRGFPGDSSKLVCQAIA